MRRGQTQGFELPDDLVIGVGDGDDERQGAGSTLPQDLFPQGAPAGSSAGRQPAQDFANIRPHDVSGNQPDDVPAQPIIAPMLPTGRLPGDGPQPKRVLVVDDDATVRLYLRARLMLRGHLQLLEAANGAQALELIQAQRFDAVLLDVDMGAQNGYDVCRAVRNHVRHTRGKQPRIYMITSRSSMLDKMRAKMAGADAFLSKPPHPGELAELLAQL